MNELDLFVAAVAITDPAARAAFLDHECSGNALLRQRLDALLAGNEQSRHPLDRLPSGPEMDQTRTSAGAESETPTTNAVEAHEMINQVIAERYTLVEVIGEGGMGSVWRAKQSEPVKRVVAVKLIKAGMDSKQVITRFEAERQALALMDHPNIAKVLDGGLHAGRPYFVMELVKGTPITEFCDARKLTPQQRLELFVPVCNAIQHAHQKGIIHRDIKPSNVLIALYDDKPVVKVIDFGVAKATGGALTEHTIDTGFGGVVGTPQYMSPEQATFNNLDIDTRSDVYALGVLLYELLAGSPPFSGDELKKKGLLEILRVVREEEPPRPSTKLSTAEAKPSISANRSIEPAQLDRLLRSELDWIVMKALEKDRTRRYDTANSFAADVQRYLCGEQVQAVPPSVGYRLKKAYWRNLVAVWVTTLFTLLVTCSGVIAIGLAYIARQAEQQATTERQRASDNEKAALRAEGDAKQERDNVAAANAELRRVADLQRRTRYAAEMNLVQAAYNIGDLTRFRALLNDQKPKPGETDLRGFEWHYWDRKFNGQTSEVRFPIAQAGERELNNFPDKVLSADGTRLVSLSLRMRAEGSKADKILKGRDTHTHVVYRVWDTTTGKMLHEYAHPESDGTARAIQELRLSSDAKRLAVFSSTRTAFPFNENGSHECWIWDFQTSAVRVIDLGNVDPKVSMDECVFSDDLEAVATIRKNYGIRGNIRVQRTVDGKELMQIDSTDIVRRIVFSPDHSQLLVFNMQLGTPQNPFSGQKTLRCYQVGEPRPLWEQPHSEAPPNRDVSISSKSLNTFQYTPDGAAVVVLAVLNLQATSGQATLATQRVLKLHDAKTGEVVGQYGCQGTARILAVNADWVAVQHSATRFGVIPMQRVRESKPKPNEPALANPFPQYETELGMAGGFAFLADGKRMMTVAEVFDGKLKPTSFSSVLGVLRMWELQPESSAVLEDLVDSKLAPDNATLIVRAFGRGQHGFATATSFPWPRLYETNGRFIRELASSDPADSPESNGFGYSGDGRFVYLGIAPKKEERGSYFIPRRNWKRLEIYDVRANRLLRKLEPEPKVHFLFAALDHDGRKLAILAEYEPTHEEVLKLPPTKSGKPLLPASRRWLLVYDVATGQPSLKFRVTGESGDDLNFDTAGNLQSYTTTRTVNNAKGTRSPGHFVWDGKTGTAKEFIPEAPSGTLQIIDRSRDGLVLVKQRFNIKNDGFEIWRTDDKGGNDKPLVIIDYPAHEACRLSLDGTRLLTYCWSGYKDNRDPVLNPPKLWDTATGRELLTFGLKPPTAANADTIGIKCEPFWSDDGRRIWVGIQRDGNLFAFDARPVSEPKK